MKAAEMVFSEYGYYPNDSHGSIVCPKDIALDQSATKFWGSYIGVCNDPWGFPYEWNNRCSNGLEREPHAPFNGSCASWSETNPGPIGITVVGSDGVNNNCTGDDICTGNRGHAVYGWDGQTIPSGGQSLACVNTISTCSGLSQLACVTRSGCSLSGTGCTGTYPTSCTSFNQTSCTAQSGCTWSTGSGSCGGNVICSTYDSNQSTCTSSGCSFTASSCSGNYACSQWDNNQSACLGNNHECNYGVSGPGLCRTLSGAVRLCSTITGGCAGVVGCTSTASSCAGAPSCSVFNSGTCSATTGCTWTGGAGSCSGTYNTSCSGFGTQPLCQAQSPCAWSSGSCTGTAASCTTFGTQNSCQAQGGCSWQ